MEWSNIRMSKAEFERLQKEYAEAAIRTAEKAKLSYDADEPKEEIPKAENIAASISELTMSEEENENEAIKPDSAKITTVQVKITEAESEITASDAEDENKESEEAETNIPVNEEKSAENTDTANTDDKQQNSSAVSTDDEASNAEINGEKSDNTADSEIPDKTENHTVDEILRSFESTFMSEEEADKKIEDFSKSVSNSRPAPDFTAKIHNHNNNQDKNGKTCGCERCRCQNGRSMQEKGGQKPN